MTIVRGTVVMAGAEIAGQSGRGQFISALGEKLVVRRRPSVSRIRMQESGAIERDMEG
jgi:hypothetical protein